MKTITITDDVYEELRRIKGKRSFSDTIRDLLRKAGSGNEWIEIIFGKVDKIDVNTIMGARRSWKIRSF